MIFGKKQDEEPKQAMKTTTTRKYEITVPRSKLLELIAADAKCEIPDNASLWAHGSGRFSSLDDDESYIDVSWSEKVEC